MKAKANALDRIIDEACLAIGDVGLAGLTIGIVAERAQVSTALIHYHFDTKARLLVAAGERIAAQRATRRTAALAVGQGLESLDALWAQLVAGVVEGLERAWLELVMWARTDAEVARALAAPRATARHAAMRRLPALFAELGATPRSASEELAAALEAELDGLTLALLAGQEPALVRTAYDAFWLTLIAAAPSRGR